MLKWIAAIVFLILLWLSGWRLHPEALRQPGAYFIARTGKDVFSRFNSVEFFDEKSGNNERIRQEQERERKMAVRTKIEEPK